MNEKLVFETLFWLVEDKEVALGKLDSKVIMLERLGNEIFKLSPEENNLEKQRDIDLEDKF